MKISPFDELIDTTEAARMLSVATATLESKRVRPNGQPIPFYKFGRLVRYKRSELLGIIEAGRRLSTSDSGPAEAA